MEENDGKIISTLGYTTIDHIYNSRSKKSIFEIGWTTNKLALNTTIFGAFTLAVILAMLVVYIELRKRFTNF